MKDIDFDELDKAVNSLMNKTAKPNASDSAAPANTPSAEPVSEATPPADTTPAPEDTPAPDAQPSTEAVKPTAPARKRSGRFMDMVHPSADMKNKASSVPVSRQGTTIPAPADVEAEVKQSLTAPEAPEQSAHGAQAAQMGESTFDNMPDPISMHESQPAEPVEPQEVQQDEPNETVQEKQTEPQSSDTPFLADAKVEKRPLGGGDGSDEKSTEKPEISPLTESEQYKTISKPEELDKPTLEPTPAELNADVVAVEASDPQPQDKSMESDQITEETAQNTSETNLPANGAINQQYKEQPSSGDTRHTAIYDAETYPATGVVHSKKRSGWMWVLWIFILLSLGAGGAVALYLMKII